MPKNIIKKEKYMASLESVLVTAAISEENKKKLNDLLGEDHVIYVPPFNFKTMPKMLLSGYTREEIGKAREKNLEDLKRIAIEKNIDAAILGSDINPSIMASPNLKWIHCTHAGVEKSASSEIFDRNIILTSSAGRNAPALAEHAMMFILNMVYDINLITEKQRKHEFGLGHKYALRTGLYGKTVSIIGLGHNGTELAKRAKAFGCRVLGYDRFVRPVEGVDEVLEAKEENLMRIARESDFVVLCVSLNNATFHMIDEKFLSNMKMNGYIINIARGGLIDQEALIKSLEEKRIAGAALDTVEGEPLSQDSPLWDMKNVLLTPHCTPTIPEKDDKEWEYVFQNAKAFLFDGEFVNRMKREDMFTAGK